MWFRWFVVLVHPSRPIAHLIATRDRPSDRPTMPLGGSQPPRGMWFRWFVVLVHPSRPIAHLIATRDRPSDRPTMPAQGHLVSLVRCAGEPVPSDRPRCTRPVRSPTSLPHVIARLIVPPNRPPHRPSQPPRLVRCAGAPVADQVGDRVGDRSKGVGVRKGNRTGRVPSSTSQRNHMPLGGWLGDRVGDRLCHRPRSPSPGIKNGR